ncbi:MAG TPA: phosphate ABC transporter permease PstA [Pseudonocardiaceae bacterium]
MTTTIPPQAPARTAFGGTGGPEIRRVTSARTRADVVVLLGAGAAGLSLAALLATRVIPAVNLGGFVVIAYVLFLVLYGVLVSLDQDGRAVRDRLATVTVHSIAVLALCALLFVVGFTFWRGREALGHLNFFTSDMRLAGPLDPLTVGGIVHAMVGTLIEITIALLITVPLGLGCAMYLNEAKGALPKFVRTVVEAMTALPSIVAGLFIYASVILTFGLTRSGLAAGLAIGVMILPIISRASDVVIRLVPGSLREASLAMGASQWRTALHVVLPTARSGLTTAVLLGTARGVGEVSPVLTTAGFASAVNLNPTAGPMPSLPLVTFVFASSPEHTMIARAFGAAVALLALVFVLFALARVLGGRPAGELSPRAMRNRARESQRDLARFNARQQAAAQMGAGHEG